MQEVMDGVDMFVSGGGHVGLTNQTGHPAVIVQYGFGVRNPDSDSPTTMPLTTTLLEISSEMTKSSMSRMLFRQKQTGIYGGLSSIEWIRYPHSA